MKNMTIIKVAVVAVALTFLVLMYSYAQQFRSGLDQKNTANTEEQTIDEEEYIGLPTGDNPWTEMDNLVSAYYNKQGVAYKGSIKLIDDNGDQEKILEEHPFEYSFSNGSFHYSLDSMEVISQADYTVAVDHRSRLVSVSRARNLTQPGNTKLFDINEFRKLMQKQQAKAEVTQAGNEKMLTIDSIQHPQIQGYRIYYDPQTYTIKKMLIGMIRLLPLEETEGFSDEQENISQTTETGNRQEEEEEPGDDETEIDSYSYYVEISYKESRLLSKADFRPTSKFIVTNNKTIELQPAYSSYQLVLMSEPGK